MRVTTTGSLNRKSGMAVTPARGWETSSSGAAPRMISGDEIVCSARIYEGAEVGGNDRLAAKAVVTVRSSRATFSNH